MIESENEKVKKIDARICDMLKEKMTIKREHEGSAVEDEIFNRINEKMQVIFSLFQRDFSINERIIEQRIEKAKMELDVYDKIANKIILRRLDNIIGELEKTMPVDGRLVSVCLDRKLFIEKILTQNIPLDFIEKCIKQEKEHDEK